MEKDKKKAITAFILSIIVLFCLFLIKAVVGFLMNRSFVNNFEQRTYNHYVEEILKYSTIFERYVPYYNRGNQAYVEGDYDTAIENYELALDYNPPSEKQCDIRVNYVLSLLHKLDPTNYADADHKDESIRILEQCIIILMEDECAKQPPEKGHDEEAQKLLEEILELYSQLQPPQDGNGTSNNSSQDQNSSDQNSSSGESNEQNESSQNQGENSTQNNTPEPQPDPYQEYENQLRDIEKNAISDRKDSLESDEYLYGNHPYYSGYRERNW